MLRPRPAAGRQRDGAGEDAEYRLAECVRRLVECVERVEAATGRLTDVATHPQAARALLGLAQECVTRRDALRSRPALRARCAAALVESAALETLLRSALAPAAASAAAAAGALAPLAPLGVVASEGALAALAELLRSGDSAAAGAAVAALTQLLAARKHYSVSAAVASTAAAALCARLAVSGARAAWLNCASALALHAAGLEALRAHAAAALASALADDGLASTVLELCAACADADGGASGAAFAAALLGADESGVRRAIHGALNGKSMSDAVSALRLLAAVAPELPRAAVATWAALAADAVAALSRAAGREHEGEALADAIASLLRRTQPRGTYGAAAAASPWQSPLLDAGVASLLLAGARAGFPYVVECWRALACLAAGGGLAASEVATETAAAACAALARGNPNETPQIGFYHRRVASLTPRPGSATALHATGSAAAGEALVALLCSGVPCHDSVSPLIDPRCLESLGFDRFSDANVQAVKGTAAAILSSDAGRAFARRDANVRHVIEALAHEALGAGVRGSPASVAKLAPHYYRPLRALGDSAPVAETEAPPWGAWTPSGDACWSPTAASRAGALLRWIAVLLPSCPDEQAPWRAPLMELLEGLAAPAGGLSGESRCWAALALRRGCGRCGARTQLGEDLRTALLSQRFADVALACGDGSAPQPAHAAVLAARCPRLLPKRTDGAVTLRGGVPPAALAAVLSWVYAASCDARGLSASDAAAAAQLARNAGLHTLAALLSDALPRPGDDMPCLARDMRRMLDAVEATADAELLPGFDVDAPPVRVHRVVCAARCDYFRAALSPAFAAGGDGAPALRCGELCSAGARALREWLYCGSVPAFEPAAPATRDAVAVAARVAAAADARLLPALAAAARQFALAAAAALHGVDAAEAAAAAAAAGEWGIASAAVYAAAADFPAMRDGGDIDSLPPQLADAIRQAHVQRARDAS